MLFPFACTITAAKIVKRWGGGLPSFCLGWLHPTKRRTAELKERREKGLTGDFQNVSSIFRGLVTWLLRDPDFFRICPSRPNRRSKLPSLGIMITLRSFKFFMYKDKLEPIRIRLSETHLPTEVQPRPFECRQSCWSVPVDKRSGTSNTFACTGLLPPLPQVAFKLPYFHSPAVLHESTGLDSRTHIRLLTKRSRFPLLE